MICEPPGQHRSHRRQGLGRPAGG